jgi:hypothetical protein
MYVAQREVTRLLADARDGATGSATIFFSWFILQTRRSRLHLAIS